MGRSDACTWSFGTCSNNAKVIKRRWETLTALKFAGKMGTIYNRSTVRYNFCCSRRYRGKWKRHKQCECSTQPSQLELVMVFMLAIESEGLYESTQASLEKWISVVIRYLRLSRIPLQKATTTGQRQKRRLRGVVKGKNWRMLVQASSAYASRQRGPGFLGPSPSG